MSGFISCPYVQGSTAFIFEAESLAFFARLSTQPTSTRQLQYNSLIKPLKDGGIWNKLDALYIFAAVNEATALTNLKSSSFAASNVGSTTFTTDVGYTGDGSSMRIDTTWNPSTAGGNFTQTSASIFAWSNTDVDNGVPIFGNVTDGANNGRLRIYPKAFGSAFLFANVQSSTDMFLTPVATGKGLALASRTTAGDQALYKDGALVDSDTGDAANNLALLNDTYGFLHVTGSFWPGQILAGGMAGGLNATEQLTLYNAMHTYLQAVAGVP